jgi:hypothetical protein
MDLGIGTGLIVEPIPGAYLGNSASGAWIDIDFY